MTERLQDGSASLVVADRHAAGHAGFQARHRSHLRRHAVAWSLLIGAIALAILLVEGGLVRHRVTFHGPFTVEPSSGMMHLPVEDGGGLATVRGDDAPVPNGSRLRLKVDGASYGLPHTSHDNIRAGTPGAFSHWGANVFFLLPPGVPNGPQTQVELSYPYQLATPERSYALLAGLFALWLAIARPWIWLRRHRVLSVLRRHRVATGIAVAAALIGVVALQSGLVYWHAGVKGPFTLREAGTRMYVLDGKDIPTLALSVGDDAASPVRSPTRLWFDGSEFTQAHAKHDDIRAGAPGTFAHWEQRVFFTLPPGVANTPGHRVEIAYPLQVPSDWITVAVFGALLALWALVELPWLTVARLGELLALPGNAVALLTLTGAGGALLYAASTFWAMTQGWSLPTTSAIRLSSIGRLLALAEPSFPIWMAALAAAAALAEGLAPWLKADPAPIERARVRAVWALSRLGLPVALAMAILSVSAVWSGLSRPGDIQFMSFMGLVPHSDAADYYANVSDFVRDGVYGVPSAWRPLAAVARTTLLALSGSGYVATLLAQILLFVVVGFATAIAVARWRGVWSGLAFYAMIYAVAREFLPTFMTELLGLIWALLAVPFFITALRARAAAAAAVGNAVLTVALLTRMGALFTPPALLLWTVASCGHTLRGRFKVGVGAATLLLGVYFVNVGLTRIYTSGADLGNNISYTLCGITLDSTWNACRDRDPAEFESVKADPAGTTKLLYRKALENFEAHPELTLRRLGRSMVDFITYVPLILLKGYKQFETTYSLGVKAILAVFVLGFVMRRPIRGWAELSFWSLFWASTILSAAVVFEDDGFRILMASYPLAALFFASALGASPLLPAVSGSPASIDRSMEIRAVRLRTGIGGAALATALLGICATPAVVRRFGPSYAPAPPLQEHDRIVFGEPRLTGVLVQPDDASLRTDVPSVHVSTFAELIRRGGVDDWSDLVSPALPATPFGVVFSPTRARGPNTQSWFVVPPDMLTRGDAASWHLTLRRPGARAGDDWAGCSWFSVSKATPIPVPAWPAPDSSAPSEGISDPADRCLK